jgi:CubicO group peptidase (beta-lactamase class C family)
MARNCTIPCKSGSIDEKHFTLGEEHAMKTVNIKFVVTATLAVCLTVAARAAQDDGIADALKPLVDKHEIAGAVTLVADKDKVLAIDTVGYADLAAKTPMRADNVFAIASMTKPITTAAILMLKDEGKLSVDDPVEKYVPELAHLKTPDGKPAKLTLRHLLTHTSGMGEATQQESRTARTLADLIPHFADKPMQYEPGSKWQYCQSGINTLGRIVEVASGESFPDFLQKRIFDPLKMTDTTFYPTREQIARLAKTYKAADGKLEPAGMGFLSSRNPTAHDHVPLANGGLFSTVDDYGRFCRMLLNGGSLDGKQYLTPDSVKLMNTIQTGELITGFTPGNGWGLGCCVVRRPQGVTSMLSPGTFGHGGLFGTQAWIDPVKQRIYVLMIQRSNLPNSDDSEARKVFQEAAAKAYP